MIRSKHRVCHPVALGISVAAHGGAIAALLFALPLEARHVPGPPEIEIALSPAAGPAPEELAALSEPEDAAPIEEVQETAPPEPPDEVALVGPPPDAIEPIEPEPPPPEIVEAALPPEAKIVEAPRPEPEPVEPEGQELITAEAPEAVEVVAKPPAARIVAKPAPARPERMAKAPLPEAPQRQIRMRAPPSAPAKAETPAPTAQVAFAGARAATVEVDARARYMAELLAWLEQHKRYPHLAQRQRRQGTALLAFVMSRDGQVLSYQLRESSGHRILDEEVEAMIRRAAPLPPIPPELERAELEVVVPVKFSVR